MHSDKFNTTQRTDGTLPDSKREKHRPCIVYKFTSRPPYEGFILMLIIVIISIMFTWWLLKS